MDVGERVGYELKDYFYDMLLDLDPKSVLFGGRMALFDCDLSKTTGPTSCLCLKNDDFSG